MTKTNFQDVIEFNESFGIKNNKFSENFMIENKEIVKYRLSLISEEYNELLHAIDTDDLPETIDALADILYVTYGFFTAIGIDADKAFKMVHESNMSKLCTSELDAIETVKSYSEQPRYKKPCYRKSEKNNSWIVFDAFTSKILKSYKYSDVDFKNNLEKTIRE